jgi:uncharacterized Fe-S cluster-containing protein
MGAEWGIYHTGLSILIVAGSQLYSKPFQVEDLLAKEEVLLWVEEVLESEPYPGLKQLTTSLREATHMHIITLLLTGQIIRYCLLGCPMFQKGFAHVA